MNDLISVLPELSAINGRPFTVAERAAATLAMAEAAAALEVVREDASNTEALREGYRQQHHTDSSELRRLCAERDAYRDDAERYRWLRNIPTQLRADHDHNPAAGGWDSPIYWHGLNKPGDELQGPDLDAAIDQARGKGATHG